MVGKGHQVTESLLGGEKLGVHAFQELGCTPERSDDTLKFLMRRPRKRLRKPGAHLSQRGLYRPFEVLHQASERVSKCLLLVCFSRMEAMCEFLQGSGQTLQDWANPFSYAVLTPGTASGIDEV